MLQWPAYFEEIFKRTHVQNPLDDGYIEVFPWVKINLSKCKAIADPISPACFLFIMPLVTEISSIWPLPQLNQTERGFQVSAALEVAGLSDFDAETGELRIFSRSGGMGGCGHLALSL
ncbi:MAG: hypothetical protein R2865_07770 [Deinococcales bacterium]